MTLHKHHKEIKAWADGHKIEFLNIKGDWEYVPDPCWCKDTSYRIKPKPTLYYFINYYVMPVSYLEIKVATALHKETLICFIDKTKKGTKPIKFIGGIQEVEVNDT